MAVTESLLTMQTFAIKVSARILVTVIDEVYLGSTDVAHAACQLTKTSISS